MADIGKITIAILVVAFWLFLPVGLMLFDVAGFDYLEFSNNIEQPKDTGVIGFFSWATPIIQIINIYFQTLIFNIPNLHIMFRLIINMMQIISLIFVGIMLRGN